MGQDNQYLWFVNINLVLAEWIIQFVSLKIAIVSPKIANLSLKIARKYHRKLQAQSILTHDKKTWETPGGVHTYRRVFYGGSVG